MAMFPPIPQRPKDWLGVPLERVNNLNTIWTQIAVAAKLTLPQTLMRIAADIDSHRWKGF